MDPLAAATKSFSSYAAMNNNPASTVDPLGLTGIGIISWVGYAPTRMDQLLMMAPSVLMDQLGMTDDLRNYNEKIVAAAKAREQARKTKQHAATQAWSGTSAFSRAILACNRYPSATPGANEEWGVGGGKSDGDGNKPGKGPVGPFEDSPNGSSSITRPDDDGYITLEEATYWYKNGNGQPLTAVLAKIDLSNITPDDFDHIGQSKAFQTLWTGKDGKVYGNITLTYMGGHTVTANYDNYDFEMHSWSNPLNWARNVATMIGDPGPGKGFRINFIGEAFIGVRPAWQTDMSQWFNWKKIVPPAR